MRWGWFIASAVVLLLLPLVTDTNTATLLAIWALFALSLGLMWGYAGLLSFGHGAYFGLGAYSYAIAAMNVGESTGPFLLAILLPAVVAAIIGAMMFYGRISDVYMGVITLVVSLILFKFMNATAGEAYRIGSARLGGFNGIPAFPILNVPGDTSLTIYGTPLYYFAIVCLLGCYLICRGILASTFGRILIGIRGKRDAFGIARLQRAGLQDGHLHNQCVNGRSGGLPSLRTGQKLSHRACSVSGSRPRSLSGPSWVVWVP